MTHDERVWHHEMETLEGIHEHAERIASLEQLVNDSLAVILGWAWKLNEIAGYDRNDMSTYPMETFNKLLQRAKGLEVPDE